MDFCFFTLGRGEYCRQMVHSCSSLAMLPRLHMWFVILLNHSWCGCTPTELVHSRPPHRYSHRGGGRMQPVWLHVCEQGVNIDRNGRPTLTSHCSPPCTLYTCCCPGDYVIVILSVHVITLMLLVVVVVVVVVVLLLIPLSLMSMLLQLLMTLGLQLVLLLCSSHYSCSSFQKASECAHGTPPILCTAMCMLCWCCCTREGHYAACSSHGRV